MVRSLGGTTKLIKNPEKHNTNDLYVHSVKLVNNTMFSKILYELLLNLKMDVILGIPRQVYSI